MGAYTDLFGYIPRVRVLEAFAENPSEPLSAPDVEHIAGVSRRAAYLIIRRYVNEGILIQSRRRERGPAQFSLNPNDLRAQTLWGMEHLLTLGGLQAEIKKLRHIPFSKELPAGIVSRIPRLSFVVDWSSTRPSLGAGEMTARAPLDGETARTTVRPAPMLSSVPREQIFVPLTEGA